MKGEWNFCDKNRARRAGRKGGKAVRPGSRYFSVNREAAAAGGRKSRYVPPKPKPILDDTQARAEFERISGHYAKLMPWEALAETTRQFWRRRAEDFKPQPSPEHSHAP